VDAQPPESDDEDAPTDLLERFGAKSEGKTSFTINDPGRRELLHHKMVDKINNNHKPSTSSSSAGLGSKLKGLDTPRFLSAPTPRPGMAGGMTPGRKAVGDLTPAAQMLFQRMGGGTPKVRERSGFSAGGKARAWTPTPKVKRKA
jgi:protein DGCR14